MGVDLVWALVAVGAGRKCIERYGRMTIEEAAKAITPEDASWLRSGREQHLHYDANGAGWGGGSGRYGSLYGTDGQGCCGSIDGAGCGEAYGGGTGGGPGGGGGWGDGSGDLDSCRPLYGFDGYGVLSLKVKGVHMSPDDVRGWLCEHLKLGFNE